MSAEGLEEKWALGLEEEMAFWSSIASRAEAWAKGLEAEMADWSVSSREEASAEGSEEKWALCWVPLRAEGSGEEWVEGLVEEWVEGWAMVLGVLLAVCSEI